MNVLVLGGTRFFGIHMIEALLDRGHTVTIATRGRTMDRFGNRVERIVLDRTDESSMRSALSGVHFDVAIDKLAYCSNDIRAAMETVSCERYIHMSSTAVYDPKRLNTKESDFDGMGGKLVWCARADFPYDEIKRQAEYALWQRYGDRKWLAVRYPVVLGSDDYTKRLFFYVEHVMNAKAMHVDNLDKQMGFIRSDEAGKFLAFLAEQELTGAINGCSSGTVSLAEIIAYIEHKTGMRAIIDPAGERAPYNGEPEYSINTQKAQSLGFQFSNLRDWIFDLLDEYIELQKKAGQ